MNGYPVYCRGCGQQGSVNKVTAGLSCRCGGAVDIYLATPAQQRFVASRAPGSSFEAWMGHTASPKSPEGMESSPGSNEYAGKPPGPTQMSNHEGRIRCPVCHGSGSDIADVGENCRECGGQGYVTPTTTPRDPEVYRHQYPPDGERNKQTKIPFVGTREHAPRSDRRPRQAHTEFYGREAARSDLYRRVREANPGLTRREAAGIVDETLRRYPEVR